jgi:hypothetical protein
MTSPALREQAIPAAPDVVSARLVAANPSGRSVSAVTIAGPGASARRAFEKRYPSPGHGRRAYRTWRLLETVDFGPAAGVPAVAGWDPQRNTIRSWPATGTPLTALPDARLEAAAAAAAAWLATLHAAPLRLRRSFRLQHELENAGRWARRVGLACPSQREAAHGLHERLRAAAGELDPTTGCAIHKDFRPDHVLVGRRLAVVDFDEMRMGDPAFDVAHFCVYLRLAALRRRGALDGLASVERAFRERYARASTGPLGPAAPVFAAYTCLKIAKQLVLRTGVHPRPVGRVRDRELRAVLAHGQRCLAERAW